MSHGRKWLYLATRGYAGHLVALDIGDDFASNVTDKTKWTKLTWNVPEFGGALGKAKFFDVGQTRTLNPTHDSLLVSWNDTTGAGSHGALYVKGNALDQAWRAHLRIGGIAINEEINNFFTVMKNGVPKPYVLASPASAGGLSKLFADSKLEKAQFNLSPGFGLGAAKPSMAKFAHNETTAFLVSREGISYLDVKDAGTSKPFSGVAINTPNYGSGEWNMSDPMTDNFNVENIVVANGKLYIGLACPHNFQGGVAIFDIATQKITPPSKAIWHRVNVKDFAVDKDGKVWALTGKALIKVKDDGTMGETLDAAHVAANQAVLTGDNPKTGY